MSTQTRLDSDVEVSEDICSLSLTRRMAALLDLDPDRFRKGDALPRGWHVMMFNPPTVQSLLRHDGAANLGFSMPDLGLPRLMMGGRKISFENDIPIGTLVVRRSSLGPVLRKEGRSGPFALVEVEHVLSMADPERLLVTETCSYVLRPEENGTNQPEAPANKSKQDMDLPDNSLVRTMLPDEPMLFRYSAITDNPHRIHYDYPYATQVEGYPALVVNGGLPQVFLLQMFRQLAGREPKGYEGRNKAPIYCGSPVTLSICETEDRYHLLARDRDGEIAIEASAW